MWWHADDLGMTQLIVCSSEHKLLYVNICWFSLKNFEFNGFDTTGFLKIGGSKRLVHICWFLESYFQKNSPFVWKLFENEKKV